MIPTIKARDESRGVANYTCKFIHLSFHLITIHSFDITSSFIRMQNLFTLLGGTYLRSGVMADINRAHVSRTFSMQNA